MSQQRQLAAIMFTDIVGYTKLMQRSEQEALALRDRHRSVFKALTEQYRGQIIQYFGDGTLSVFKSTVEAVNCAIEMQRAFQEDPIVPLRIGIHVGDIIQSNDDIIGDAVNIAARIESCAVANSILISDKVNDQIRSQQNIEVDFIDAFEFKNVETTIPLFAISNDGLAIPKRDDIKGKLKSKPPKSKKKILLSTLVIVLLTALSVVAAEYFGLFDVTVSLNDKSIAVLPFDNLSFEEDAEIFRDGMTEDILTNLAKIKELHVISKTSVARYRDTKKNIGEIAKELGVSYILVGSIQMQDNQVRIHTQLIEAKTDKNIWAEKYDATLNDIFKIQTNVSTSIAEALKVTLTDEEQLRLAKVTSHNLEAYKYFLQGKNEASKRNIEGLIKSIELFQKAIVIEPEYAEAYAEIAHSIYLQTYYGTKHHVDAAIEAREYLDKAERYDSNIARIYSVRGLIHNIEGKPDIAKKDFERALTIAPNDLTARQQYANLHYYTKEYEKQLEQARIAYSLDPLSFVTANTYFTALLTNKKFDEAEKLLFKIEAEGLENNQNVIHRSFIRLYLDKREFENVIPHAEKIIDEYTIWNRFLGYSYGITGDTVGVKRMIKHIYKHSPDPFKSHQLAVVYAGIKRTDSVIYYLDTLRNKQHMLFARDRGTFFEYLEGNDEFKKMLEQHGLE